MKPKEYVKKYQLNKTDKFNHSEFVADLTCDFMAQIEFHSQSNWNYSKFKNCIKEIRQKFDAIFWKAIGTTPEKLWSYFYATVVIEIRDKEFGEFLHKEKKKREEERNWHNQYNHQWDWFRRFRFMMIFDQMTIPIDALMILGLNKETNAGEIKNRYRKLALTHHPDRGGKQSEFIKITEAKNKCLAYYEKEN